MSQYRLDISGNIDLSDYSSIYDYIELVDTNDSFTITFEKVSNDNIGVICSMLEEKNFTIDSKQEIKDGKVSLLVVRQA